MRNKQFEEGRSVILAFCKFCFSELRGRLVICLSTGEGEAAARVGCNGFSRGPLTLPRIHPESPREIGIEIFPRNPAAPEEAL